MMEDNSAHFFEGTEKLLEVWFSRQDETKGTGDLRTIPRLVSLPSPLFFSSFFCLSPRQVSPPAAGCPPPARARARAACLAPLRHFIQHTSTRFNATNGVWSLYVRPATTKLSPDFSNRMDVRAVDGWRAVFSPQALEAASLRKMATSPCTVARRR